MSPDCPRFNCTLLKSPIVPIYGIWIKSGTVRRAAVTSCQTGLGGRSCFRDMQDGQAADQHLSSCRNAPTRISHHLSTTVLSVCRPVCPSTCVSVVRLIIAMMMMVSTENRLKIFFLFQLESKSFAIRPPLSPSHLYLSSLPPPLSSLSPPCRSLPPSHISVSSPTLSLSRFSRSLLFYPCGKCD